MNKKVTLYTGENGHALFQARAPFIASGEPDITLPYSLSVDKNSISPLAYNMYHVNPENAG